jgi:hypothetical protein
MPIDLSEAARAMNRARKTQGGGRPRKSGSRRCPCQVMTLKRAKARGKTREHEPGCDFYPWS